MNARDEAERQRRAEAEASLARAREHGAIADSALETLATKARDHLAGADGADPVEVWGKRIGRLAALIVGAYLVYMLVGALFAR